MNELNIITKELKKRLVELESAEGKKLAECYIELQSTDEYGKLFEELWDGGWGQANYDHYKNPRNRNEYIQVNDEFFYAFINEQKKMNLDDIEDKIANNLKPYKDFQKHLITELSIIRDQASFNNENEILKSIEEFKWGFEINDYIKVRKPSQIPVYDISQLNKGLQTPPHIIANGFLISLTTKSYSVRNFVDLSTRIIRQIELKTGPKNLNDDVGYSEKMLIDIFNNFHSFCTQLKNRHNSRNTIEIKDEYDVQDILHAILKLHFIDIREEEYTPSYAGSSTRMDFLLKNEGIVIEVKKTREKLTDKEIGEQLILDTVHYKNHPSCNSLKCFVYDPENRVRNPRGLENDLNKLSNDDLVVDVFIRP